MDLPELASSSGEQDIDAVITWVDGSDPGWLAAYTHHAAKAAGVDGAKAGRFRDLETMRFVLRGIECFMPWIRRVHLVTAGHIPPWLNREHPRLRTVTHAELFEDPGHLPTFNSGSIEMNLHRVPGLADQFIYFNDDTFVLRETRRERLFKRGLPRDYRWMVPLMQMGDFSHRLHHQMAVALEDTVDVKHAIDKAISKDFWPGYPPRYLVLNALFRRLGRPSLFEINHHPQPYLRGEMEEFCARNEEMVSRTSAAKFRGAKTMAQHVFRFASLARGDFSPVVPSDSTLINFNCSETLSNRINKLGRKAPRFLCMNDSADMDEAEFQRCREIVHRYLVSILPNKSRFEL